MRVCLRKYRNMKQIQIVTHYLNKIRNKEELADPRWPLVWKQKSKQLKKALDSLRSDLEDLYGVDIDWDDENGR